MKILQVIHGYPLRFNCGSEIYSQTLCHGLAINHKVRVFTRQEDPYQPEYIMSDERDELDSRIRLHVVNVPMSKDRYRREGVDRRFAEVIDDFCPDIIHIGHLNHLSTSLVCEAADRGIPVIFTLHDYWLMCPRGQFIQMNPETGTELWNACDGQDHAKCAEKCYARYFTGDPDRREKDVQYWTSWVCNRMEHVREIAELVDLFIAPSRYLMGKFITDFGIPCTKIRYLDYGFDLARLEGRQRNCNEPFTFGYVGSHTPAKGIHLLIGAFAELPGSPLLRIWGRSRGYNTDGLVSLVRNLPEHVRNRIDWLPEYKNTDIIPKVFNRVDAIVVPSLWQENSPLVIHEALQAGVPVITSDCGGMSEYIKHKVNGLLFMHRNVDSLAQQMQRLAGAPDLARQLGERGYLQSENGAIPDIGDHVNKIEDIYREAIEKRRKSRLRPLNAPWRITLDTNPDDCNLHCIMCEEHSRFSAKQDKRRYAALPPRKMPIELVRRIVRELAGKGLQEVIPSTMGEPLLYKHFEELIDICSTHGIRINLTTNGTFPGKGARRWAELIVPVGSDVKISLNGADRMTQESIMVGSDWEQTIGNIGAFIEFRDEWAASGGNRCSVTLQMTFLETNYRELPDIVRLASELGADRVKGHHVWTHFDEIKQLSMRRDADSIARWNETVSKARAAVIKYPLANGKKVILDNIYPLKLSATEDIALGSVCPFLGQEAWINTEGRFDPCCAPDDLRQTLGSFGKLNGQPFQDIWIGEKYRMLLRSWSSRSVCLQCNMRRPGDE